MIDAAVWNEQYDAVYRCPRQRWLEWWHKQGGVSKMKQARRSKQMASDGVSRWEEQRMGMTDEISRWEEQKKKIAEDGDSRQNADEQTEIAIES